METLRIWIPARVEGVAERLLAQPSWLGQGAAVLRLRRRHDTVHADLALADGVVHVSFSPWEQGTAVEAHVRATATSEAAVRRRLAARLGRLPARLAVPTAARVTAGARDRGVAPAATGTV